MTVDTYRKLKSLLFANISITNEEKEKLYETYIYHYVMYLDIYNENTTL